MSWGRSQGVPPAPPRTPSRGISQRPDRDSASRGGDHRRELPLAPRENDKMTGESGDSSHRERRGVCQSTDFHIRSRVARAQKFQKFPGQQDNHFGFQLVNSGRRGASSQAGREHLCG